MRHGKEAETEQRMDAALRVDGNPFVMRSLEIETIAADGPVARLQTGRSKDRFDSKKV